MASRAAPVLPLDGAVTSGVHEENRTDFDIRLMKKLPILARLYVVTTVFTATLFLIMFARLPEMSRRPEFLGLALAAILTSAFKLHLPTTKNRATMSVSFVVDFTSLLVFGPGPTLLIAARSEERRVGKECRL